MAKRYTTSTLLTRDNLLAAGYSLKKELLELDGMGSIYVRELTGRQMVEYNETIERMRQNGSNTVNVKRAIELAALLVSMSACDKDGRLLFSKEDVEQLADISFEKLKIIADKTLEISGITEVAANLKKAFDSSTTDLPMSSENQ